MSIPSSTLPPLDPKDLQRERFMDEFGTQVTPKENVKKPVGAEKTSKVFKEKHKPEKK